MLRRWAGPRHVWPSSGLEINGRNATPMGRAAPRLAVLWAGNQWRQCYADGPGRATSGRPLGWKSMAAMLRRWAGPRAVRPSSGLEINGRNGPPMGRAAPRPAVLWAGNQWPQWSADGPGRAPSGRPLGWKSMAAMVRRRAGPRAVRPLSGLEISGRNGPPMGWA